MRTPNNDNNNDDNDNNPYQRSHQPQQDHHPQHHAQHEHLRAGPGEPAAGDGPPAGPPRPDGVGEGMGVDWPAICRYFGLTKREGEVLRGVFEGRKFQEIANQRDGSRHTVETHWRRIKAKMGPDVKRPLDAVHKVYEVSALLKANGRRERERGIPKGW